MSTPDTIQGSDPFDMRAYYTGLRQARIDDEKELKKKYTIISISLKVFMSLGILLTGISLSPLLLALPILQTTLTLGISTTLISGAFLFIANNLYKTALSKNNWTAAMHGDVDSFVNSLVALTSTKP